MLSKLPRWIWIGVWILATVAGFVNVIGFAGFSHQALTHLTGTASMIAASVAALNGASAIRYLTLLLSFVFGAVVSGYIIGNSALKLGRHYGVVLILESALLFISPWFFEHQSYWGLYMASCACGLQNAMVTTYSGAVIRTTHVSGMFTDLGIFLGNALRGVPYDVRRLQLCSLVISGFVCGGILGGWAYGQIGVAALYIPATTILAVAFTYFIYANKSIAH